MAKNKDGLEIGQLVDFETLMRVKRQKKEEVEQAEQVEQVEPKPKAKRPAKKGE